MYKRTTFSLVLPENDKPIMLDDTCYFIGFENLKHAKIAHCLLNHEHTQQFLKAIIFPDAKRSITKEVLMRIDIGKLYNLFDFNAFKKFMDVNKQDWDEFGKLLLPKTPDKQLAFF